MKNYQNIIYKLFEDLDQYKWSGNDAESNEGNLLTDVLQDNIISVGIDAPKETIKYSEILKQILGYYYVCTYFDDDHNDAWIEDGSYTNFTPYFELCGREKEVYNRLGHYLGRFSQKPTQDYIEVEGSLTDLAEMGKLNHEGRELFDLLRDLQLTLDKICTLGHKHKNLFTFFNLYNPEYTATH